MTILYWAPWTRSLRAAWMLEELGIPYTRETIDIRDQKRPSVAAFDAASPLGKVPALVDDAVSLADTGAICLYLADRYPEAGLAPAVDAPERGPYLFWMMYIGTVLEPAVAERLAGTEPRGGRNGWATEKRAYAALVDRLNDRQWLPGEWFSAADVMVGSTVLFFSSSADCRMNRLFGPMVSAAPAALPINAPSVLSLLPCDMHLRA